MCKCERWTPLGRQRQLFFLSCFPSTLLTRSFYCCYLHSPLPAYVSVDGSLGRPWLTLAQLPPPLCSLWWWGSVSNGTDVKSADWAWHWITDSPEFHTLRRDRGKTDFGGLSYGFCIETSLLSMTGHKPTKQRVNDADGPGWCLAAALSLSSSALQLFSSSFGIIKLRIVP